MRHSSPQTSSEATVTQLRFQVKRFHSVACIWLASGVIGKVPFRWLRPAPYFCQTPSIWAIWPLHHRYAEAVFTRGPCARDCPVELLGDEISIPGQNCVGLGNAGDLGTAPSAASACRFRSAWPFRDLIASYDLGKWARRFRFSAAGIRS